MLDRIAAAFCGQNRLYLNKKGFKDLTRSLEVGLVKFLKENQGRDITFYFGNGDFNARAFSVLYGLKDEFSFKKILVCPYPVERLGKAGGYDGAVCPFSQPLKERALPRRRNEWLVDNSDVLFALSEMKAVYDVYMLDYAKTRRQITGKPQIILISPEVF